MNATVVEAKQCRQKKGQSGENTQDLEASYSVKKSSTGQENSKELEKLMEERKILLEQLKIGYEIAWDSHLREIDSI